MLPLQNSATQHLRVFNIRDRWVSQINTHTPADKTLRQRVRNPRLPVPATAWVLIRVVTCSVTATPSLRVVHFSLSGEMLASLLVRHIPNRKLPPPSIFYPKHCVYNEQHKDKRGGRIHWWSPTCMHLLGVERLPVWAGYSIADHVTHIYGEGALDFNVYAMHALLWWK